MTPRNTKYAKYDPPGAQVSDDALAQKYLLYTPPSRRKRKIWVRKAGIHGRIFSSGNVSIISLAEEAQESQPMQDFWGVLKKWERMWMWENLQWIGDEGWLAMAIAEGMCIAVANRSYMKDLYPTISLAAVILECMKGRGRVWCSFPEASRAVCSYRGELVGLMALHLILLAINKVHPGLHGSVQIYSDCLGALHRVKNLPASRIQSSLAHSDVLKNILVHCSSLTFEQH